jgi:hypothetical protein
MLAEILAEIMSAERNVADVVFLIAVLLAGIAAVLRFMARAIDGALVAAAVALIAFGLMAL